MKKAFEAPIIDVIVISDNVANETEGVSGSFED
jgi:hypothetical protein